MMKLILLGIILMSFSNTAIGKENWQSNLDSIAVPEYFDQTNPVYLEYVETVKDFKVTAKLFPFGEKAETGYVILHFERSYTNESYYYISPEGDVYTSYDLYGIAYDPEFPGYRVGKTYSLHYVGPKHKKNRDSHCSVDPLHPFGYYTPFQFLDIDSDGRTELVINEWDQLREGNTYMAFDMENNELLRIDSVPFRSLTNSDKIDPTNKTITVIMVDGDSEYVEVTYERRFGSISADDFTEFESGMTWRLLNEPIHPRFSIKYLYEKVNDKETKYVSK